MADSGTSSATSRIPVMEVRCLSPAYWYVCDAQRAKRLKCRAMVAGPFASKLAAEAAIAKATKAAS